MHFLWWKKLVGVCLIIASATAALANGLLAAPKSFASRIPAPYTGITLNSLNPETCQISNCCQEKSVDKPPAAPTGPTTVEEVLNLKSSLTFDDISLEFALNQLASDAQVLAKGTPFGKGGAKQFEIRYMYEDFRLQGITRNSTLRDFRQEGKTIGEILTALMRKANPDTTVKSPDELDQKLVWVVAPSPDDPNKWIVLITAREVAKTKTYTLPAVFVPKK